MCVLFSEEGEDKMSHYSIIVLGISTLGTSVLLWWLYKELAKHFSGKDEYDLEGVYVHVCTCIQYVTGPVNIDHLSTKNCQFLACLLC